TDTQKKMIALGIDPVIKIDTATQRVELSRVPADIYKNRANLGVLQNILSQYGLKDEVYDKDTNPNGLLLPAGASIGNRSLTVSAALYELLGVRLADLAAPLGVQDQYTRKKVYYSESFFKRVAELTHERQMFPLQQAESIPALKNLSDVIRNATNLSLPALFVSPHIPPIAGYTRHMSLSKVLTGYAMAVSGQYNITDISKALGTSQNVIRKLF